MPPSQAALLPTPSLPRSWRSSLRAKSETKRSPRLSSTPTRYGLLVVTAAPRAHLAALTRLLAWARICMCLHCNQSPQKLFEYGLVCGIATIPPREDLSATKMCDRPPQERKVPTVQWVVQTILKMFSKDNDDTVQIALASVCSLFGCLLFAYLFTHFLSC